MSIDDMRLVVADIGVDPAKTARADVNGDGRVNVEDLQAVIDNLNDPTTAEAPAFGDDLPLIFNAELLRAELDRLGTDAQRFKAAIAVLQRLLVGMPPE